MSTTQEQVQCIIIYLRLTHAQTTKRIIRDDIMYVPKYITCLMSFDFEVGGVLSSYWDGL